MRFEARAIRIGREKGFGGSVILRLECVCVEHLPCTNIFFLHPGFKIIPEVLGIDGADDDAGDAFSG